MSIANETEVVPEGEDFESQDAPDVTGAVEIGGDLPVAEHFVASKRGGGWGPTIAALVIALLALGSGLSVGYLLWGDAIHVGGVMPVVQAKPLDPIAAQSSPAGSPVEAVPGARPTQGPALPPAQYVAHLPESYTLPVSYGNLGPELVEAGAIDLPAFLAIYTDGGKPLPAEEQAILTQGSDAPIVIDRTNAHFLLNFFWAVGLANRNAILFAGSIQDKGADTVDQYASTGGWTLASKPIMEIFASLPLIKLNADQQERLQTVAEAVYRPCCGNSTAFPDCNHGMAMLGILELMAAGDASEDQCLRRPSTSACSGFRRR